ncbi:hypothetical protein bthur0004_8180 [Bacillus thuringiensis serovar sotto str. T04001]|nr:hypothetical protein bthur0004_8180 [Bacillus thuringiensis serovar sotto str. T04001]
MDTTWLSLYNGFQGGSVHMEMLVTSHFPLFLRKMGFIEQNMSHLN